MIVRLISGGQNGADEGGLRAGKTFGLETGGTMPAGFRTLDGPKPEFAEMYGVEEHESEAYPPRTYKNVKESDATIRFATDFTTAGEKCTMKAIEQYGKPYFDVQIRNVDTFALPVEMHPQTAAKWLIAKNIQTLNVAGNSEKSSPGIGKWVERYITVMLNTAKAFTEATAHEKQA